MIKRNRKKLIIAIIFIPILYLLFHPVFHKKEYIQKYSYVELPESAEVISWHIDFHPLFGIDLPYIKLKIDGDTYNSLDHRTPIVHKKIQTMLK